MLRYIPNSAGWQLYSKNDSMAKPDRPVPMPDVSAVRSKNALVNKGRMAEWAQAVKPGAIRSFKKGGIVHKTGLAMLHKGEVVVPKHKVDKWLMSDTGIVGAKYSKSTDQENATS